MITYMELFSKEFLPKFRAMVAQEMAGMGINQKEIAKRLHITQAAVSQYIRNVRGKGSLEDNMLRPKAYELANTLASRKLGKDELAGMFMKYFLQYVRQSHPDQELFPSWFPSAIEQSLYQQGVLR